MNGRVYRLKRYNDIWGVWSGGVMVAEGFASKEEALTWLKANHLSL